MFYFSFCYCFSVDSEEKCDEFDQKTGNVYLHKY